MSLASPLRRLPLAALTLSLALSPRDAAAQAPPSDLPPLSAPPAQPPPVVPSSPPPGKPVRPPVAQPPPPGYGYGYPPYGYGAPPGYGGYPYPAPAYPRVESDHGELPPPPPRRRYDNGLFAGGVVALVAGMTAVFIGAYLVSTGTDRIEIYCDTPPSIPCAHKNDAAYTVGGAVTMALGAAVAAAGLPMWFIGSRYVTIPAAEKEKKPAFVPEVRVGAGSASVTLRF